MSASAHGGVRPWWEQGSRVTQAVAPTVVGPRPPGGRQGHSLGVEPARWLGGPLAERAVDGLDDAADPRVRRGRRPHGRAELEGSGHALGVGCGGHVVSGACGAARGERNDDRGRPGSTTLRPRSHPDSHRRLRDLTGSAAPLAVRRFAGYTAGRDFHPTPRGLSLSCAVSVQLEHVLVLVTFVSSAAGRPRGGRGRGAPRRARRRASRCSPSSTQAC